MSSAVFISAHNFTVSLISKPCIAKYWSKNTEVQSSMTGKLCVNTPSLLVTRHTHTLYLQHYLQAWAPHNWSPLKLSSMSAPQQKENKHKHNHLRRQLPTKLQLPQPLTLNKTLRSSFLMWVLAAVCSLPFHTWRTEQDATCVRCVLT